MESINTYQGETPESAEHVEEMVQKAETASAPPSERPEWLPEKFKSPEELAKAYSNLETKLGKGEVQDQEEEGAQEEESEETPDPEKASDEEVSDYLETQGINYEALSAEYAENGQLSEAAYEVLEGAGIPKYIVDQFIAGREAMVQQIRSTAFDSVGGQEEYNAMVQWAASSLSKDEQEAFNASIDTQDHAAALFAIKGLHARYRSEVGKSPRLVTGAVSGNSGGSFASLAELTAAMKDRRYEADPAYRAEVARKLRNSNVL